MRKTARNGAREYTSGLSENELAGRRTDIFLIFASKQCRLHGQGRGNISHTGSDGRSNMGNDFRFDEAVVGRGDDAGRNHVLPLSDRLSRAETVQADFQTARKLAGRSAIRGGRPHGRLALFSDREHGPANNARLERSAAAGYRSDSDSPALETMAPPAARADWLLSAPVTAPPAVEALFLLLQAARRSAADTAIKILFMFGCCGLLKSPGRRRFRCRKAGARPSPVYCCANI